MNSFKKAFAVFLDDHYHRVYLLTNFSQNERGLSGFVENGLFDMKIEDNIFKSYYGDGTLALELPVESYTVVEIDYDGGDYNEAINNAIDVIEKSKN